MTETLHGIQVTCRCSWWDGENLCGSPAPYLLSGTSYCREHALAAVTVTASLPAGRT